MTYEMFQQGPAVYVPILLLSLVITVVAYGAFPFIFANVRDFPITKKKYKGLCYGINAVVLFLFLVMNGGVSSGAAYFLWTVVFSSWGIRILEDKDLLTDGTDIRDTPTRGTEQSKPTVEVDKILFCRKCGERLIDGCVFCHKCGTKKETQVNVVDEIQYCPKCGVKIIEGGAFCHKCGAEIATVFEEKIPITDSVVDEKFSGEPILLENGLVKCPACNYVQEANRKVCWNCGYKFDNEKSNASATHMQRCDDYDKTAGQSPCELCGKQSSQLTYAVIKDDMGTRYRNLCDDCITRYNAKPKEEKSEDSVILEKQFVKEEAEGTGVKCELCGKFFPKLTYSTIKDDMGTRYRNICDDCIAKYNAKPKY